MTTSATGLFPEGEQTCRIITSQTS
jgi:hypothetical protein